VNDKGGVVFVVLGQLFCNPFQELIGG